MRRAPSIAGLLAILGACSPCDDRRVRVGALEICAEVADTEAARAQGLAGRAPLEADEGLLLDFPVADEICIVNAGVGFAIDAIYVAPSDEVVAIERDIPADDPTPRCVEDTKRVLEVSAGVSAAIELGSAFSFDD